MSKVLCDRFNTNHIKTCKTCINYHKNLEITPDFSRNLQVTIKNHRNLCIISGVELIYLMKGLRVKVLEDNRAQSTLMLELKHLYTSYHNLPKSYNIDNIMNILTQEYSGVIIEDIFDALNVIFHAIHNTSASCTPMCPVHKAVSSDIIEKIVCKCGYSIKNNIGTSLYYHLIYLKNSIKYLKQFKVQNTQTKCFKCKSTCDKSTSLNDNPNYVLFKIVDDRKTDRKYTYESIDKAFEIGKIFDTPSSQRYELAFILVKANSLYKCFFIHKNTSCIYNGEFFSITQAFELISLDNLAIVGLIYSIVDDEDSVILNSYNTINSKTSKLVENLCECGSKCSTGENICERCNTLEKTAKIKKAPENLCKFKNIYCTVDNNCELCLGKSTKNKEEIKNSETVHKSVSKCTCTLQLMGKNEKCAYCISKFKSIQIRSPEDPLSKSYNDKKTSIKIKSVAQKCLNCQQILESTTCRCKSNAFITSKCCVCLFQYRYNLICFACGGKVEGGTCRTCENAPEKLICEDCNLKNCDACRNSLRTCKCRESQASKTIKCFQCAKEIKSTDANYCRHCKNSIMAKNSECKRCKNPLDLNSFICYACLKHSKPSPNKPNNLN